MGSEQKIIDKIMADAKAEVDKILADAKAEADQIKNAAKEKADKELAARRKLSEAEAEKAGAKEISGAEMAAKKRILEQKQEILEETIQEAFAQLTKLSDSDYESIIEKMLAGASIDKGTELILSKKDKGRLKKLIEDKGLVLSEEERDITGGFIVKQGDIEYNYSFEAILSVEKEQIEQLAAEQLFS